MRNSDTVAKPSDVSPETKKCPLCAETIRAEAKLCHFCGAQFSVTNEGYCQACHDVVALDDEGACAHCGGEVIDRHFVSELIAAPAAAAVAPTPVIPGQPGPPPGTPTTPTAPTAPTAPAAMTAPGAPPPSAAVAPPAPPAAPVPQGTLRVGFIGTWRQTTADNMVWIAAAACMLTTVLGFGGEKTFLVGMKDSGLSQARPGLWFFVIPIIAAAISSRKIGPRGRISIAYRQEIRRRYGIKGLYKMENARSRVIGAASMWVLSLILASGFAGYVIDRGYSLQPGGIILIVASIAGLAGSILMLPGKDNKLVHVDDRGELFQ